MNLLKQMIVDGTVWMDYAHLMAEYQFEASDAEPQGFRYFFPVPQGGQVTGIQLLDREGRLLRGEICTATEDALSDAGLSLVRLSPCLYCLTVQPELPVCRVLVQLLLPLSRRGDRVRFVFPSGMEMENLSGENQRCRIQLNLELDADEVFPVYHQVEKTDRGIAAEFESGADFILEYLQPVRQSAALVQETLEETLGVYRLFSKARESYRRPSYKRVLLLLDTTGTRDDKRFAQVKELFLRVLQALPQEMVVQAVFSGAPRSMVLPSFMSVGETLTQILFQALKVCPRGGDLREMLEHLPEHAEEETMVILISSGCSTKLCRPLNQKTKIHLFTIGTAAETPLAEFWYQTAQGAHRHFYPGENLTLRTDEQVNWLFSCCGSVEATFPDTVVQEWYPVSGDLAADGYLDIAVRCSGAPPQTVLLRHRNTDKELVAPEQLVVYTHLNMVSQIFALAKLKQLTRLLSHVDVGSVRAVKAEIEKVSLHYGVLSPETMLAIQTDGVKTAVPVRLVTAAGADSRPTVFGESGRSGRLSAEKMADCVAVLVKHIHCDGSVCDGQAVELQTRRIQTAWGIVGLCLADDGSLDAARQDAEAYLGGWLPTGQLGDLYQARENLYLYGNRHRQQLLDLCKQVTEPKGVIAAAKLLIKNSLS